MKKIFLSTLFLTTIFCSKNNDSSSIESISETDFTEGTIIDSAMIENDQKNIPIADTLSDSINEEPEIKPNFEINTFSQLPIKFNNESEANAYLYLDLAEADKDGMKYGVCDFINNVAIIKINNEFEKLKNISKPNTYIENMKYENSNYRLELDLNEKVSKKVSDRILNEIPLEGFFVLKGKIKIIDKKNNTEEIKNTFVLGSS